MARHTAIEKASEREDYGFIATDSLATENLKEERAEGRMAMLDFFKKSVDTGQNISSLQRVGLAASAGESESIRLQRRQLFKADSMDKLLFNQNKILNEKL